ncbi:hypothetical protein BGZ98_000727 [Dissophora globulifera]|nr:hypothetical protein BGZ98_000727 [Dissophora globulifera]
MQRAVTRKFDPSRLMSGKCLSSGDTITFRLMPLIKTAQVNLADLYIRLGRTQGHQCFPAEVRERSASVVDEEVDVDRRDAGRHDSSRLELDVQAGRALKNLSRLGLSQFANI